MRAAAAETVRSAMPETRHTQPDFRFRADFRAAPQSVGRRRDCRVLREFCKIDRILPEQFFFIITIPKGNVKFVKNWTRFLKTL